MQDKRTAVSTWLRERGVAAERAAYLGNDVNDQGAGHLSLVGWPVAVHDAWPEVREHARLVLTRRGGHGAVRELCDLVVSARSNGAAADA